MPDTQHVVNVGSLTLWQPSILPSHISIRMMAWWRVCKESLRRHLLYLFYINPSQYIQSISIHSSFRNISHDFTFFTSFPRFQQSADTDPRRAPGATGCHQCCCKASECWSPEAAAGGRCPSPAAPCWSHCLRSGGSDGSFFVGRAFPIVATFEFLPGSWPGQTGKGISLSKINRQMQIDLE